jgi:hypothetical protein
VAIAATGPAGAAVASAVALGPAWPVAAPLARSAPRVHAQALQVYDASPEVAPSAARATLVLSFADPDRAIGAARALEDRRSVVAERLDAALRPGRRRDVSATAHAGWGCVRMTFDLPAPYGGADPPVDLARAIGAAADALTAPSVRVSLRDIANRAGDPRDAAERLAYWTLVSSASFVAPTSSPGGGDLAASSSPSLSTAVGVGLPRARMTEEAWSTRTSALQAELDRSGQPTDPAAELRVRVERGQSGVWMLLASPCGTEGETGADAGASAMAAMAIAERGRRMAGSGETAEAWVAPDGVGLVVHAFPDGAEAPSALAARAATLVGESFGAALDDPRDLEAGRTAVLSRRGASDDVPGFALMADAIAPGHPSWILPSGTWDAVLRSSDEGLRARLEGILSGPLRLAVLADHDAQQGSAALEALRPWLASRAGARRACPGSPPVTARPGTYAIEAPGASSASAWLAFALPAADPAARAAAALLAAALDGSGGGPGPSPGGGLLERALSSGLARSWSARVVGPPRAPALVVHVASAQGSLDAAVAEVRVLFDRLRQEGLPESVRREAIARAEHERLLISLDPRARLVELWRGDPPPLAEPGVDALRDFATRTLRDDALIIVASRPPRVTTR